MQGTEFRLVGHLEQPELLRQALAERLWQSDWYRRQDLTTYSSLIVRRPVLAILPDRSLLVTSTMLLADALNLFVETSFMPELPESAFEQLIASDFEQRVVELFRGQGFRAGPVTLSGVRCPKRTRRASGQTSKTSAAGCAP
ncbi:hypothetical protein LILAB_06275 [Corallococcus macrosporus]|uniref:Uncharacterized protein n=1 Tax=Myxococcus fulvus (strain ATCC BAA-855 / HW-1) TaxID=483219 RepID=F8C8M7_MYXFH|nr:hypothetical protein LILAB_06275 [Corallococcus macrosporus]